jgi:hypothetical protein
VAQGSRNDAREVRQALGVSVARAEGLPIAVLPLAKRQDLCSEPTTLKLRADATEAPRRREQLSSHEVASSACPYVGNL